MEFEIVDNNNFPMHTSKYLSIPQKNSSSNAMGAVNKKKAVLVTYKDVFASKEAVGLAEAAGYEVAEVVVQGYIKHGGLGLGPGVAERIKNKASISNFETIIIDAALTSSQIHQLGQITGLAVIDRDKLILDIFESRATTGEAKLQVKLAELTYELPRVRQTVRLSKKGERQGSMGLGEYAVDVQFRSLKKQMSSIKEKLLQVQKRRSLYRTQRQRLNIPFVSLVGYTGSGKTTLFNRMSEEEKEVANSLFTTLGTTTRTVILPDYSKILLSDTVGFITRIPTYMIEAFKSTLDELFYADLVLLMVDASEPSNEVAIKYYRCLDILNELRVPTSKVLVVLNKSDKSSEKELADAKELIGDLPSIVISAKHGAGTRSLKNRIRESLKARLEAKILSPR